MDSVFSNRLSCTATFERLRCGNVSRSKLKQMSSALVMRKAGELTWQRYVSTSSLPALLFWQACDFGRPACIPRHMYSKCNVFAVHRDESLVGDRDSQNDRFALYERYLRDSITSDVTQESFLTKRYGENDSLAVYDRNLMPANNSVVTQRSERHGSLSREAGRNEGPKVGRGENPRGSRNSKPPYGRSNANSSTRNHSQADQGGWSGGRGEGMTPSAGRWMSGDRPNHLPARQQQQIRQQKYGMRRQVHSTSGDRRDDSRTFADWSEEEAGEIYREPVRGSSGYGREKSWRPGGNQSSGRGSSMDRGIERGMQSTGSRGGSSVDRSSSGSGNRSSRRFTNDSRAAGRFASEYRTEGRLPANIVLEYVWD